MLEVIANALRHPTARLIQDGYYRNKTFVSGSFAPPCLCALKNQFEQLRRENFVRRQKSRTNEETQSRRKKSREYAQAPRRREKSSEDAHPQSCGKESRHHSRQKAGSRSAGDTANSSDCAVRAVSNTSPKGRFIFSTSLTHPRPVRERTHKTSHHSAISPPRTCKIRVPILMKNSRPEASNSAARTPAYPATKGSVVRAISTEWRTNAFWV
jgi:hypothetical protein